MVELSTHPVAFVTVIHIVAVHLAAKPQLKYSLTVLIPITPKLFLTSDFNTSELTEFMLNKYNERVKKNSWNSINNNVSETQLSQNDRSTVHSNQKCVIPGIWDKIALCKCTKDMVWLLAGTCFILGILMSLNRCRCRCKMHYENQCYITLYYQNETSSPHIQTLQWKNMKMLVQTSPEWLHNLHELYWIDKLTCDRESVCTLRSGVLTYKLK